LDQTEIAPYLSPAPALMAADPTYCQWGSWCRLGSVHWGSPGPGPSPSDLSAEDPHDEPRRLAPPTADPRRDPRRILPGDPGQIGIISESGITKPPGRSRPGPGPNFYPSRDRGKSTNPGQIGLGAKSRVSSTGKRDSNPGSLFFSGVWPVLQCTVCQ
jgi:hypothetical protein